MTLIDYISPYELNNNCLLNDLTKINDNRFSLISTSNNKTFLYITLFDLYNNDLNLKIRFYIIDLFNLYNYKLFRDLSSIKFNNLLTISMSVCNSLQCEENTDNFFTSLLIFGFFNHSNSKLDNSSYDFDQENNTIIFDNNIFGYQITKSLKVISIPDEINFYAIINGDKKQINVGDDFIPSEKLVISTKPDIVSNNNVYYIEYQNQYSEPDYDTFNKYPDIIKDYLGNPPVDQREEYNNNIQVYYGKTLKIEFTLCNDKCKTCKLIRKSDEQEECEECKDNLRYYFNKDANLYVCLGIGANCPEEYPFFTGNDSLQCLKECPEEYPFYSTNNSNNSFQCFKECPEDYPFLKKNISSICQKDCDYDDLINNKCILNNKTTDSLKKVHNIFTDLINDSYINEEIVFTIGEDLTFQLSNTFNEKSNLNSETRKNKFLSVIDLGECEIKLKIANGIDVNLPLIILKVENFYDNTGIKNVQYELFNPVTKEKISDLSPCKEESIDQKKREHF
jgi:hypothetical protein